MGEARRRIRGGAWGQEERLDIFVISVNWIERTESLEEKFSYFGYFNKVTGVN